MASKQTTVSLNCSTKQAFEIALKAISQVSDIAEYVYNDTELAIEAHTEQNMKTFGDDIYIQISGSENVSFIDILSETDQLVDWGRNAENLENIIAQIREEANKILPQEVQEETKKTEEKKSIDQTLPQEKKNISVEQTTPITKGSKRHLPWRSILCGIIGIAMALYFLGVFDSKSTTNSVKDSNDPSYYYGAWSSNNNKIEVMFGRNNYAKCKLRIGNELIEYETEWAVSPDNGVFWGTYYGHGEYNFMTPQGHLYHYIQSGDRYIDEEISLTRK